MRYYLLFVICIILSACKKDDEGNTSVSVSPPNILLIITDDMGKDATSGFSEGSIKPHTPNLDQLKNSGLTFNNLWVYPTCTPTRASIITGKYGYRTGVKQVNDVLSSSETILQKFINEQSNNTYASAIVGKWHLSGNNANTNPESFGIDYYAGLIRGSVPDYYQWQLTQNGSASMQTGYSTQVFTNLATDWVLQQSKPWFLWLAYNAPHTPFHLPPSEMHSQGNLPAYTSGLDPTPYYMAAIEAVDYQVGKLLDAIPEGERENTVILFIGDNGSPGQVAQFPYTNSKSKGSLYQGGINVPFFVSGKGVSRTGQDNNLISSTDFFSTIASLAGVNITEKDDSKSFKSLFSTPGNHRSFQYSEKSDGTNDSWTISNGEYKLIVSSSGQEEMYKLSNDPYETNELISNNLNSSEQSAKAELEGELSVIRN